ncbi:nuclear transport factor 2 family protein [Altererythrobacter lauratis]|uniref:Nuclear transport factor 2 family protein n=1 Tax=Alteraurantiacibacter lauratis TaxID=2054627 RepID=A0ABV7EFI3_9SPHN
MAFDPAERALAYLECVRRLDTAAMLGFYAPDARVWLPGQGWMQPAALAALLDGARSLLADGIRFTHEDVFAAGNRAVVLTACDSPLVKGGSYINQFCFVITFDDAGQITELREYTDSAPAVAAFHS